MAQYLGRPFDIKPGRRDDKKATLRRVFSLPSNERHRGQVYEVEKILQENPFLMRYAGTKQLSNLIYQMHLKSFDSRTTVINQGEEGETFYIILSGRVAVLSSDQESLKIKELIPFNSFGEQNLLTSDPSPFTYMTLEPCEMIILSKSSFESSVKTVESQNLHKSYLFFKGLPVLSRVSEKLIHYFSQVAFIKRFMPNSVVIQQDEFASGIYVISEGTVKIKRKMENKIIVIDELGVGEFFCDNSFFTKGPMHHSVVCSMPLETYYLDKDDLNSLEAGLLSEFRKACKPYPDDCLLLSMYFEQKIWKNFKEQVVQTVVVEKELRK
jgi:CRP-like cAMP-binding protein